MQASNEQAAVAENAKQIREWLDSDPDAMPILKRVTRMHMATSRVNRDENQPARRILSKMFRRVRMNYGHDEGRRIHRLMYGQLLAD